MKWAKPQFYNRRFGFEVTMYVFIANEKFSSTLGLDSEAIQTSNRLEREVEHEYLA